MKIRAGIVKSMGIYTLSNMINASIPFVLLPVLTQYLSTDDYGILSNFGVVANILLALVGINLMASIQVQYLREEVDNRDYLTSVFRLNLLLTAVFSGLTYLFSGPLHDFTGVPLDILYLMGIYALFLTVVEVLLAVWRMEDKAVHYGVFRIGRTVAEVSLVVFFVVINEMDFRGSVYAMMIAYAIGCIVAFGILLHKRLVFGRFRKDYLSHALRYGAPLIPHALGGLAILYADKLILTYYHGLHANGVYSVGFLVGQSIGLLQNSFNQAWVPWVYQKLRKNERSDRLKMVKITYVYLGLILVAVVMLWLVIPYIYSLLGKEFQAGMGLVLWIGLGFAFNGMYKMVSVYLFYLEKTMVIATMSIGAAALNIVLNFMFVPKYAAEGAALATLTSMFVQFIIAWWISSRYLKMPWLLRNK